MGHRQRSLIKTLPAETRRNQPLCQLMAVIWAVIRHNTDHRHNVKRLSEQYTVYPLYHGNEQKGNSIDLTFTVCYSTECRHVLRHRSHGAYILVHLCKAQVCIFVLCIPVLAVPLLSIGTQRLHGHCHCSQCDIRAGKHGIWLRMPCVNEAL